MTSLDPHTGIVLANGRWCTWGHVMPGSGAVYGDALTALLLPKNWDKPLT